MDAARIFRHLVVPRWMAYRAFPRATLGRIEQAIRESECAHDGELRFAIEAGLGLAPLLGGMTSRQRALEVFGRLGVANTRHGSGVLVYVQLVDRRMEIVADHGISARVDQGKWDEICRHMEAAFRSGDFEAGSLAGIAEITGLLARHFPPSGSNPDELPDRPVVL